MGLDPGVESARGDDHNAFATGAGGRGMSVLPSGFSLPPMPYLLALGAGAFLAGAALYRRRPRVTPRVVAAFAPWMVAGATLYALYQVDAIPVFRPLFGAPAVYLTTFVPAAITWVAVADQPADRWGLPSAPGTVALTGVTLAGTLVAYALVFGLASGALSLQWPVFGLLLSIALAATLWYTVRDRLRVAVTGAPGVLVLFGHTLDGISTAVGVHLGYGEQTPLSALIIDLARALPTEPYLGAGWLFAVVKVGLAVGVLYAFTGYVREEPSEGALMLGLVAAVGLGPGVHNLVLFAIS